MADKEYFGKRVRRFYSQVEQGIESDHPDSYLRTLRKEYGSILFELQEQFPNSVPISNMGVHRHKGKSEPEDARADLIWMKSQLDMAVSALSVDLNNSQESSSVQPPQNVNILNQSNEVSLKQQLELHNDLNQVQKLIHEAIPELEVYSPRQETSQRRWLLPLR
jgi:hypothetical protein